MEKSKKIVLTVASSILTLIILSIAGGLIWYQYLNANYYLGHGSLHAEKVANIAIQKNNPNECLKIKVIFPVPYGATEESLIQECYFRLARTLSDATACNYISDNMYKNSCYTEVAIATKNLALCDKIQGQRMQYYIDDCKRHIREANDQQIHE